MEETAQKKLLKRNRSEETVQKSLVSSKKNRTVGRPVEPVEMASQCKRLLVDSFELIARMRRAHRLEDLVRSSRAFRTSGSSKTSPETFWSSATSLDGLADRMGGKESKETMVEISDLSMRFTNQML